MASFSADTSELRTLARDFRGAPSSIAPKVNAVIAKGANNIKRTMQEQMRGSTHFKGAAVAIDYEWFDGDNMVAVEIGPKVGPGESGGHAGIAYGTGVFGGPRGGGSVRDPMIDLEEEVPQVEKFLAEILGDVL